MDELIDGAKDMLEDLKARYEKLQEAFKAETDVDKMDALDTQIVQIGKDIVTLESKVMALEVAAKKSSFDPNKLGPLVKSMADHRQETARAGKEYTDSIAQAKFLASRVTTGIKVITDVAKAIV